MSYDLFLTTPLAPLQEILRHRAHWTLSGATATYENRDTGVYFTFALHENPAFNINYCRASFFGLEAAEELDAVLGALDVPIHDPQDGMERWSKELFLQGWNRGNRHALQVMRELGQHGDALPDATMAPLWAWNYGRSQLQAEKGDEIFVPLILMMRINGQLQTACVWHGEAVVLPETELVIGSGEGGFRVVAGAPLRAILGAPLGSSPLPYWEVEDIKELQRHFHRLPPVPHSAPGQMTRADMTKIGPM